MPIALAAAVFALAAFLAVYAIQPGISSADAPPGADDTFNPRAGDKCEIDVAGLSTDFEEEAGPCSTAGDSLDVVFTNATDTAVEVIALVTGGSDYNAQARSTEVVGNGTDMAPQYPAMALGKRGIDLEVVSVPAMTPSTASGSVSGKTPVTLTRTMSRSGEVYLFIYPSSEFVDFNDDDDTNNADPIVPIDELKRNAEGDWRQRTREYGSVHF